MVLYLLQKNNLHLSGPMPFKPMLFERVSYSCSSQYFGKLHRPIYILKVALIMYYNFGYKVWDIYSCEIVENTLYIVFLTFIMAYKT